jgi:hypothetical protein
MVRVELAEAGDVAGKSAGASVSAQDCRSEKCGCAFMSPRKSLFPAAANENKGARSCTQGTIVHPILSAVAAVRAAAVDLWRMSPRKPTAELMVRTAIKTRSAKYIMSPSGAKGLSADALAQLLVSDAGARIFREFAPHLTRESIDAYREELDAAELALDEKEIHRRRAVLAAKRR